MEGGLAYTTDLPTQQGLYLATWLYADNPRLVRLSRVGEGPLFAHEIVSGRIVEMSDWNYPGSHFCGPLPEPPRLDYSRKDDDERAEMVA